MASYRDLPLVRLGAEAHVSATCGVEEKRVHNSASWDAFVISIMENFPSGTNLLCQTLPGAQRLLCLFTGVLSIFQTPRRTFISPRTAAVNLKTASVRLTCYYSPRGEKFPKTRGRSEFPGNWRRGSTNLCLRLCMWCHAWVNTAALELSSVNSERLVFALFD